MSSRTLIGEWVNPRRSILPHDLLGILLVLFIIGSVTLFGQGQLVALGFLLAGSYALYFLKQKRPIPTELIIQFAWVAWSSTGFIVCLDGDAFREGFMLIVQIWIMTFAIAGITMQRGTIGTNFLALIIGGVIMLATSYMSGELAISASVEEKIRIHGITANPNHYAYILLIAIISSLYFLRRHFPSSMRILIIAIMCMASYGIMYSASRKAFMGLVVLIPLWAWMCYRKEFLRKKTYIIMFMMSLAALYLMTDYMLSNTYMGIRFKRDFVEDPIPTSHKENKRVTFYKEGFAVIKEKPLFGIGLGNFPVVSKYSMYSHSDYIEIASTTGIVGFFLYFSVYVVLWRRLNRVKRIVREDSMSYDIGLLKASIIVVLLLALGRPNVYTQINGIFIGSAIGYAWSMEMKAKAIRRLHLHDRRDDY